MGPTGIRMGSGEGSTIRNSIVLYRLLNIIWVIKSKRWRLACHVARMEEGRSAFKILTGRPTPTGKRQPRRRWEGNIRMNL